MPAADGAIPRWMREPYDYPQSRRTGEPDTLEVTRSQGSVENYVRQLSPWL
jgi:hypothetical protein